MISKTEMIYDVYTIIKIFTFTTDDEKIDSEKEKDSNSKGQEYRFVDDFGEQMVGKHQTVIVIFDLETNELEVLGRKKETQAKGTEGPNMIIYYIDKLNFSII